MTMRDSWAGTTWRAGLISLGSTRACIAVLPPRGLLSDLIPALHVVPAHGIDRAAQK